MARELRDSVEMNGDLRLKGGDMTTRRQTGGRRCDDSIAVCVRCPFKSNVDIIGPTDGGRVTVQVNVSDDPSSSGPLETLRVTFGVGTTRKA